MTATSSADPQAAVAVSGLVRDFGPVRALDGATFSVGHGEIFGLLGPNGAGKTTAMRILLTLLRPTAGRAEVAGLDVLAEPVAVRRRVGWVPQEKTADPLLTTRENLLFMAGMYHLPARAARQRAADLLALAGLDGAAGRLARDLSGGMRRRLELAMGLVHVPAVLFLDEPTLGLDVGVRRGLWAYLREIRRSGTTVVLTTHYLDEADALCDRVAIIDRGRIRATGTPAGLKQRSGSSTLEDAFLAATGQSLTGQPPADDLVAS
jgi:ABC-2 type transport system ATP-binding protein